MSKAIVLLSDGTGNSSAAFFKSNVWRVYEALDQSISTPDGRRQIAYYDNGVGTSTFKPLAVLGGVFGVGLKRNILDLYKFACRNFETGDDIYLFGFSRGAFTVRLVADLIATEGLKHCSSDTELDRVALDTYRHYRRCFNQTGGLVTLLRDVRDAAVRLRRALSRDQAAEPETLWPSLRFLGVWDTVAAYGMPIQELTRAIDRWVWPLSMPNYQLSSKVQAARHALALDDERDTFHPLVWDENHEAELIAQKAVGSDRLQQVWFAGMHSDVGGGYPDDSLSYVSLDWMLQEARRAGLRFKPEALTHVRATANPFGPMHDSRSGLGGYYRYHPRGIDSWLQGDPARTVLQHPDWKGKGLLRSVVVHDSVIRRIERGTDHYAPIVLPCNFRVLGFNGLGGRPHPDALCDERARAQEAVWDDVWLRRLNYFSTVGVSFAIALMPWYLDSQPACIGPQCLLSPIILLLGALLPGFLEPWIESFARNPGVFAILVGALGLLLLNASRLQRRIHDRMASIWQDVFAPRAPRIDSPRRWIRAIRTNTLYRRFIAAAKWRVVPDAFGVVALVLLAGAMLVAVAAAWLRWEMVRLERFADDAATEAYAQTCGRRAALLKDTADDRTMRAQDVPAGALCWATGIPVTEGKTYRVAVEVKRPWIDSSIVADPRGFGSERIKADIGLADWFRDWRLLDVFAPLMRRSLSDPWFRPLLKIVPSAPQSAYVHALITTPSSAHEATHYVAEFTAARSGEVVLFVNDALERWRGWDRYYANNAGLANFCIEPIERDGSAPRKVSCLDALGVSAPGRNTDRNP